MKTVTFQLKGEYIDQIKAGSKVKEYRALTDYNIKRLCSLSDINDLNDGESYIPIGKDVWRINKDISHIQFFNGYRADRREMICEIKDITIEDNPEGDDPGVDLFVISLGKIVKKKNF